MEGRAVPCSIWESIFRVITPAHSSRWDSPAAKRAFFSFSPNVMAIPPEGEIIFTPSVAHLDAHFHCYKKFICYFPAFGL